MPKKNVHKLKNEDQVNRLTDINKQIKEIGKFECHQEQKK